ncbi:hypothetical protein JCM11491_001734 [Sporobolomyces phaffii]
MSTRFSARASMYPTAPPPSHWSALEQCSLHLAQSSFHLETSIDTLDEATRDFPRLASVIESNRVYDLVPGREIVAAQRAIDHEMRPRIERLVDSASVGLERLKESERQLRERVDRRRAHRSDVAARLPRRTGSDEEVAALERTLARLRSDKDRLGADVARLEREVDDRLAARTTSTRTPSTTGERVGPP